MKQQHLALSPWLYTTLITAAIYAASPLHRFPGGDSGELMAEACVNGVAHPPGYPLLLSLLQISQWMVRRAEQVQWMVMGDDNSDSASQQVPFAHIANVMNSAFAVGAAACTTQVVDLWARREFPVEAMTAGLMFATSKLVWEYAIGLEVHIYVLLEAISCTEDMTGLWMCAGIRTQQPAGRGAARAGRSLFRTTERSECLRCCVCMWTGSHKPAHDQYVLSSVSGMIAHLGGSQHLAVICTAVLFEAPFIAAALLTRHLGRKEILWCAVW